jgi:outer membrane protein OmpA-like peptidoglycan-associated protein
MERIIAGNPNEAFVIEGHTDLVGSADYNEALSWRRADAVRQALTEFFYIPEQNLEIVGYGEQYPRIPTEFEEPENRRVTIRRITPILYGQQ